jgi:hypothetical protein
VKAPTERQAVLSHGHLVLMRSLMLVGPVRTPASCESLYAEALAHICSPLRGL